MLPGGISIDKEKLTGTFPNNSHSDQIELQFSKIFEYNVRSKEESRESNKLLCQSLLANIHQRNVSLILPIFKQLSRSQISIECLSLTEAFLSSMVTMYFKVCEVKSIMIKLCSSGGIILQTSSQIPTGAVVDQMISCLSTQSESIIIQIISTEKKSFSMILDQVGDLENNISVPQGGDVYIVTLLRLLSCTDNASMLRKLRSYIEIHKQKFGSKTENLQSLQDQIQELNVKLNYQSKIISKLIGPRGEQILKRSQSGLFQGKSSRLAEQFVTAPDHVKTSANASNTQGINEARLSKRHEYAIRPISDLLNRPPSTVGSSLQSSFVGNSTLLKNGKGQIKQSINAHPILIKNQSLKSQVKSPNNLKTTVLNDYVKHGSKNISAQARAIIAHRNQLKNLQQQKENIPPKQTVNKPLLETSKFEMSVENAEDFDDRCCEVDEEIVADEREEAAALTHNLMLVKQNAMIPLRVKKSSHRDVSPKPHQLSERDEDIIQLSRTQHLRRIPLASSIMLLEKKTLNMNFQKNVIDRAQESSSKKKVYINLKEIAKSRIASFQKREGSNNSENVESDNSSVANDMPERSRSIGVHLSKMVMQRKHHQLQEQQPFRESINERRRMTDLHEARLRNRSHSRQSLENLKKFEGFKLDHYQSLGIEFKSNHQGPQQYTSSEKRYLHHLDLPMSKSISSLDDTLKAVKNLLKKNQSVTSLISLKRQGKDQVPSIEDNQNSVSGTSILFREHQRKSLQTSKSEIHIPPQISTKFKIINDNVPDVAIPTTLNQFTLLSKMRPPTKNNVLHEKRLERQASTTMSFQQLPLMVSNPMHNISATSLGGNENLAEFFQLYETFKHQSNDYNPETHPPEIISSCDATKKKARSQRLMVLRLRSGTGQRNNFHLNRSFQE